MRRLPFYHGFANKSHEPVAELAERLIALMPVPMSKVFFNNSGSEANDTAIKLVWYYNNALGRTRKKKIIGRAKGYHGVTVATASLTGLRRQSPRFRSADRQYPPRRRAASTIATPSPARARRITRRGSPRVSMR